MARTLDLMPSVYHDGGDVEAFIQALDVELDDLEAAVGRFTELSDVDRCPVDSLPYLARTTGAPLLGNDPLLWRRQIRNWPYIVRLKGTLQGVQLHLLSLGVADYEVYTYWRNAEGEYVTENPEGEPFEDAEGKWRNYRTHYYGLKAMWDERLSSVLEEALGGISKEKIERAMAPAVPFHAELLRFSWGLVLADSLEISEAAEFHISARYPLLDLYPWRGLRYGFFDYGDMLTYGTFSYGDRHAVYGGGLPGTPRYGDDMPDLMELQTVRFTPFVEQHVVPAIYGQERFGEFPYGEHEGPVDGGAAITVKKPLIYGRFSYGDGCPKYGDVAYGSFAYGGGVRYGGVIEKEWI